MVKTNYYIKISEKFLMSDKVKYLMSLSPLYVLLYQNLALTARNTNGRLEKKLGELTLSITPEMIYQDTFSFFASQGKEYNVKFIEKGLDLFLKLDILGKKDEIYFFNNYEKLVGKSTFESERKRAWREKNNGEIGTNVGTNAGTKNGTMSQKDMGQNVAKCPTYINSLDTKSLKSKDYSKEKTIKIMRKNNLRDLSQNDYFEKFWKDYPKKRDKANAKKAFVKLNVNEALFDKIINALKIDIKSDQWFEENGKFIPYPSTWLHSKRWEDDEIVESSKDKIEIAKELTDDEYQEIIKQLKELK